MRNFILLALTITLTVVLPVLAFAADTVAVPAEYAINVQSPLQALVSLIFGLVGGLLALLSKKLFGKDGKLPLDDEHTSYLNNAITSGLALGESKVRGMVGNVKDPTVQNQLVATAVNFVLASVPSLLVKYDITPVKLRQLILERLGDDDKKTDAATTQETKDA